MVKRRSISIPSRPTVSRSIGHAGAHHHAEGGELEKGEDAADDDQREQEVDEAPCRIDDIAGVEADSGTEIDHALGGIGRWLRDRIGAKKAFDDFLQNDRKAEGNQNLFCMRTLIEKADQTSLHRNADDQHDRDGGENRDRHGEIDQRRAKVAQPGLDIRFPNFRRRSPGGQVLLIEGHRLQAQQGLDGDGTERAQHEQRAMGKVDDAQRAENDREAKGDQGVGAPLVQTIQDLQQNCVHCAGSIVRCRLPPAEAGSSRALRVADQAPSL